MKRLLALFFFLPSLVFAQNDSVLSGAYSWKQPVVQKGKISSVVLLEGKVHDFEWMQFAANSIAGNTTIKQAVSANQEQLLIVRSGAVTIHFGDSSFLLTANSIAVLMPGEKYSLSNASTTTTDFFTMNYRSKKTADAQRGGTSFVKIWESIPFKGNNIGGGRRDFFEKPTVMQKRFEMHVTTLKEGLKSHEPHTHRAEEIILVIEGETEMQMGNNIIKTTAGGFYYAGSKVLHGIKNIGTKSSTYFAIQFE
ncbi:cupin domain-containing protein [Lacibacter sediminis]|uniref:Cupin domain-containing protein n=1 Tax=Lacibacter sediminis TaxID=2760713 RepID=A0A7G5XFH0_9BACT|nr:cupin domain-containing protein [Lacibacter sediminis]QNA44223.1 cupin domain-containing protein [Lacibacter sediminis]